ncbi:YvcK family protein [Bacillus sp. DX1.1]|uniref:gluconeogenesis factor YvcK family protein n=1 Tax=unclassified Bacillus (in: firmicutes) TaxID=185979 RepID=UPI0025708923|nr:MULTISPECIES: YvcK family protein [unclassified Bacillus (in: firmicutes)]MDM5157219.1 YvcK family protein [Bacillus sp. DX1.1]WJE81450.1 YvcK family protein [Bacillus sp. DX3.1]
MKKERKPRIVIMGGGTGLSVLLRGLKKYPVDITAVVTVADDGGSSGRLRDELAIPPPGDIRNVLVALSDVEPLVEALFQHRFTSGEGLTGHALGNLLLAGMTAITGDFFHAITETSKVLNVRGRVLPAANQSVVLHAELEDGQIVTGESKIPYFGKKINRVFLTPGDVEPLYETLTEIQRADLLVFGPGSLYTSILPNLIVKKIGDAVLAAKAKKVYVCNVMTQAGETMGYTAFDHVQALHDHLGKSFIDTAIVNNHKIPAELRELYAEEMSEPVVVDEDCFVANHIKLIQDELAKYDDKVVRHDTLKLASILYSLL